MTYTYITKYTSSPVNWKKGRQGNKVQGITIHHWGSSHKLSILSIVQFLCSPRPNNPTSAHYVVQGDDENGKYAPTVYCIVDPDDTAYHAGNWDANLTEIGVECRPYPTEQDYRTVAELIVKLRSTYGNVPLYPHKHWASTECPGNWDLNKLESYTHSPVKTTTESDVFDMGTMSEKQLSDLIDRRLHAALGAKNWKTTVMTYIDEKFAELYKKLGK